MILYKRILILLFISFFGLGFLFAQSPEDEDIDREPPPSNPGRPMERRVTPMPPPQEIPEKGPDWDPEEDRPMIQPAPEVDPEGEDIELSEEKLDEQKSEPEEEKTLDNSKIKLDLGKDKSLEEVKEEEDKDSRLYGNPYRVIITRNLFDLKAGVALGDIITNEVPIVLSTNNLKFMGITTVAGVIKSHFMISKPGQQPPQQYISLMEGQASDGLECVSINADPRNPTAKVKADGKEIQVSFETHGITATSMATGARQTQTRGRTVVAPNRSQNQPRQTQIQRSTTAGGFNMPAVQPQNLGLSQGNANVGSSNRRSFPMTTEARNFQNRRSSYARPAQANTGGNPPMPPMPPGM